MNYKKQADDFAKKNGITLTVIGEPRYKKHFPEDKDYRWVFRMRLSRNKKIYSFNFGQSISDEAKEPTMYDVLACLQKYDVGSFEDFCSNFGYDENSRNSERTYKAVCKEYEGVQRVMGDIIDDEEFLNIC